MNTQIRRASDPVVGLDASQKQLLLQIAREALEACVRGEPEPELDLTDPKLMEPRGCFVTLTLDEELRGCIGYVRPVKSLCRAVSYMACQAALHDPRFDPVTPAEAGKIRLEISVLSPMVKLHEPTEVQVGLHGLMIVKGAASGLLLPQVATEHDWDRETFLDQTCVKAGLPTSAWRRGADIYVFSAEIFGEPTEEQEACRA
jgi:AmmeMemoRadiSam system protein A